MVRSHEEALSEDAEGWLFPKFLNQQNRGLGLCPSGGKERLDQEVRALLAKSRS